MNAEAEQLGAPRLTQDERRIARRQAILDAAESLFLEYGYPSVSLSAIVQRSGGSLATIYQMFGNKQGLLRAVVDRSNDEYLKDLDTLLASGLPPRRILEEFALRYLALTTTPRKIAFMRLVIVESLTDPDFGEAFDNDMQLKYITRLASLFESWNARGIAQIDRPRMPRNSISPCCSAICRSGSCWAGRRKNPHARTRSGVSQVSWTGSA